MRHGIGGQGTARREGRVDGHHLRVHGQARVGVVATSAVANDALDRLEVALVLGRVRLVRLDVGHSLWQDAGLQDAAAVISRATIVEALADDLASLDDNAAMAVMEGGLGSLLEAKIQVLVSLHCCGLRLRLRFRLGDRGGCCCLCDGAMLNVVVRALSTCTAVFQCYLWLLVHECCRARGTFGVGCREEGEGRANWSWLVLYPSTVSYV